VGLAVSEALTLGALAWAFYVFADLATRAGWGISLVAYVCLVPVVAWLPEAPSPPD